MIEDEGVKGTKMQPALVIFIILSLVKPPYSSPKYFLKVSLESVIRSALESSCSEAENS